MLPKENNRTEYKVCLTDNLEKEVVAFLNYKEGGTIYIGVADDGQIVGVDNCDKVQLDIKNRLITHISPNIMGLFDITCETIENKEIIKIILASGSEKPYYIKSKGMSESGCFIRIGSAAQPMTTKMIEDLFRHRVRNSITEIPSRFQDLTFNQLRIYYDGKGKKLNDNFARNLELLTSDGKYNFLAYLLSDKNNVSVRFAEYWDKTKVNLRQINEYGDCSIIKALNTTLEKLEVANVTFARITGAPTREERRLVDAIALREIVINAFVHNDYTDGDTPLIEQFSDRFVVTSYGGLVDGLTQEEFFKGISKPRNRELMRIFKDLELVEHLGSGMNRIMETYNRSNFEFSDNFLRVTIPFNQEFEKPVQDASKENVGENVGEKDKWLLSLITKNDVAKAKDYAVIMGVNQRTVERQLAKLKDKGLIKRVGPDKGGHWEVIKK